jgi:dTDP-4-amino-4,6-dideoxygalactose transaminase
MPRLIPPVGNRICLDESDESAFSGREDVRLYASGTAALAAALAWASQVRKNTNGEVLVPAYGCPALVAAAFHAGLRPVLVDLAPSSPFPDPTRLQEQQSPATLACLHVNFLGIQPPVPVTVSTEIAHVYDCCQGWPAGGRCPEWAESTVVSFGRGKPITLGTGGALLVNRDRLWSNPPPALPEMQSRGLRAFLWRSRLYNCALSPKVFWWIDRMPGLHVGKTFFRPLDSVRGICAAARRYLDCNIRAYEQSDSWTVDKVDRTVGLGPFGSFRLPKVVSECDRGTRLLRLPLLAESRQLRDAAVDTLRHAGYGATAMYGSPLWKFSGLESLGNFADRCPNAVQFADRLITLPLHDGVSVAALQDMVNKIGRM